MRSSPNIAANHPLLVTVEEDQTPMPRVDERLDETVGVARMVGKGLYELRACIVITE